MDSSSYNQGFESVLDQQDESDNAECVVTLVHGTFAPKASWAADGSGLREAVAALAEEKVQFHPFVWEGKKLRWYNNTHGQRHSAALRLREHLRSLLSEYPNARHFVIAHSHGGNVTLQALRDRDIAVRLSGVACLATPFLTGTCSKPEVYIASLADGIRKFGWLTYLLFFPSVAVAVSGIFALLFRWFLPADTESHLSGVLRVFYYTAQFGGALALCAWGPGWLKNVDLPRLTRRQSQIAEQREMPDLGDLPVFVARAEGDEAWAALRAERWFEKVLTRCAHWSLYLLLFISLVTSGILAAMTLGQLCGELNGPVAAIYWDLVLLAALAAMIVFTVAFYLMAALLFPFIFLWPFAVGITASLCRFLCFGRESVVDGWLFRGVVAAVPDGISSQITLREYRFPREYRLRNRAGWLRHCSIYNRPEVLADLIIWMRNQGVKTDSSSPSMKSTV